MSTAPTVPAPLPPALSLPAAMAAGDFLAWSVLTGLPAGSAVSYFLSGVVQDAAVRLVLGPVATDANGVAAFSLATAVTVLWTPALYQWVCYAYDLNGNRTNLASGQIVVAPDPTGAVLLFPPSDDERLLANIKSLLQGRGLEDAQMYKIGSRELTKMTLADLLKWEGVLEARVRRARRRRAGRDVRQTIGVTFTGDFGPSSGNSGCF